MIEGKQWRLNTDCTHYNIKTHSPEWYEFRNRGFGASEAGVVTRSSDWDILPKLIERKAGLRQEDPLNESMLGGLLGEDGILTRWRYYDGNGKSYVQNYVAKMIFREFTKFSGYMVNKNYPILFTSTDAWAMPKSMNLISGELMAKGFPVEAKQINGFHTDRWVAGVPPQYIFQANQEMLIFGLDYMEFAILKNGSDFEVIPMEVSDNVCNIILERSEEAWDVVLKVRELKQEKDAAPYAKKEQIQAKIDSILPLPDENPLYKQFYSEKYTKTKEEMNIPDNVYEWASKRVRLSEAEKMIAAELEKLENNIRREFQIAQTEFFDAGSDGKLRYYLRGANAKNHTLDFGKWKSKPKGEFLTRIETIVEKAVAEILG